MEYTTQDLKDAAIVNLTVENIDLKAMLAASRESSEELRRQLEYSKESAESEDQGPPSDKDAIISELEHEITRLKSMMDRHDALSVDEYLTQKRREETVNRKLKQVKAELAESRQAEEELHRQLRLVKEELDTDRYQFMSKDGIKTVEIPKDATQVVSYRGLTDIGL